MDIQLTDFENTALTVFTGMIANVVNTFDVDFFLPVSLVDANMKRAHLREAVTRQKFWWKVPVDPEAPILEASLKESKFLRSRPAEAQAGAEESETAAQERDSARYKELTIAQILNGDASVGMP